MSPDSVRELVSKFYPQLFAEPRSNPYGWSFFLGPKVGGSSSNRIFRVIANAPNHPSKLKLAVTSRLSSNAEFTFRGDEAELKALIDREIQLYEQHFDGR
jgi:hypothetical protein